MTRSPVSSPVLSPLFSLFGVLCLVLAFAAPAWAQADDPAEVEAGQAIYESNCAGCHAMDGTGSAAGRPLTDVAGEAERAVHIQSVTEGKGVMPAFGEKLAEEEISAAVSYVRIGFASTPAETPAPEADDTELARTGVETPVLLFVGVLLLSIGVAFNRSSRRV